MWESLGQLSAFLEKKSPHAFIGLIATKGKKYKHFSTAGYDFQMLSLLSTPNNAALWYNFQILQIA